ncbi:MAG TPA: FAD-dependent oxidoreductase [Actinomycetota bacterium]|jgi:thioredoxin reductase (NADPH)|nr:FAD-dependent oxidoreductase [Actinomycetota bacterium]
MADQKQTDQRAVILAVDDDPDAVALLGGELSERYGRDYRVVPIRAFATAVGELERMHDAGERVALVLADQWLADGTGAELLTRARELHPHAKRALLISWGEWAIDATNRPLRRGIALGDIDYYVLKPWRTADELFHRAVTEFLHEWVGADVSVPREFTVVADAGSARGHEIRQLLTRNSVPFVFHASTTAEGGRVLAEAGCADSSEPVVVQRNGRVLIDPSNVEIAQAYGVLTQLHGAREFDVAVIGAGPAGLAAAVYASSEGLRTIVIERESIGGQAGASSKIRNYLGFQRGIAGAELAQRAYQQAWVFGTTFLLMCEAHGLRREHERLYLSSTSNPDIPVGAVVLAMGVNYQRLAIPALEELSGTGVFYGASASEAERFTGGEAFVVGGGNSAGQAAVHIARYARNVTILVRGTSLAASMSKYLIDEIDAKANIEIRYETQIVDGSGDGRLESLTLQNKQSGETETVPADALFVLIGARPHTHWLPDDIARDDYGFVVTTATAPMWQLERPPYMFETTMPGVFAVGDVRSGSVKRVASAAGEGSVAIQQVHKYLDEIEWAHH